jgi:hypothetical protein
MSLGKVGLLPATPDDVPFIKGTMVAESFEVVEVVGNFCQFKSALNVGLGMEVGFSLCGVGVHLFVGIDHLVVGDSKPVNVSGDSPVVEFSRSILDEGIGRGVPSKKVEEPSGKWLNWGCYAWTLCNCNRSYLSDY